MHLRRDPSVVGARRQQRRPDRPKRLTGPHDVKVAAHQGAGLRGLDLDRRRDGAGVSTGGAVAPSSN